MKRVRKLKDFTLNFGPQHPAAHGVLRLVLNLKGEFIKNSDAHIGLLHRATEKLAESKTFTQVLPYFDRLDYVSMMSQEHAFSLLIESFFNKPIKKEISLLRVVFTELTRILNHLLAISTHALDVGAMTPFLWAFEEREKIMEFYERASGARMHANFIRPFEFSGKIQKNLINDINVFCKQFTSRIEEIENMLNTSRIWKQRLVNVGIINTSTVLDKAFSGVMMRGSGLIWDLRIVNNYENLRNYDFQIPIGEHGDCYDRYLIRIEEMRQSLKIINKALINLNLIFDFSLPSAIDYKLNKPERARMKNNMEILIHHFKFFSEGVNLPYGDNYISVEAPKGEFGVYLFSNFNNLLYRMKIRAPGFFHLQGLNSMIKNHMIADLVTIIGTQDIVFGEVDR